MDSVIVLKNVIERLLDVKVFRGEGRGMSDHFLVEVPLFPSPLLLWRRFETKDYGPM